MDCKTSMAKGGFVGKGEMVWKKMTSSQKADFLYKNFTPEITPASQHQLSNKTYQFLPQKVKIAFNAKYANVDTTEMAKGGNLKAVWAEYEENEDNNYHGENVVLLAKHFGTKDDLKEANAILKAQEKAGYLTDDLRNRREKLNDKLWPIAKEKMAAAGVFAKGGTMNKSWSKKIDKSMKAKKAGWRKSAESGEYYYEDRPNRSDKDRKTKLAKGGSVSTSELNDLIEKINTESGANFSLRGAYGNYELWAKTAKGENRIEVGSRKDIKEALIKNRYNSKYTKYAHGGMTEHGLKTGDKIVGKSGSMGVKVYNKQSQEAGSINLDKGSRNVSKYAKGGYMKKGGKAKEQDPPIVRGYADDEPYEYGKGGSTGCWCYDVGGL